MLSILPISNAARWNVMTAQIEAVDFFAFDNSYARLPERFFARLRPAPVAAPRLVRLNKELVWHLRLDPGKLAAPEGVEIIAGNRCPRCELASNFDPVALHRKPQSNKRFSRDKWGHDWTPDKSPKNGWFPCCAKYLKFDWGGVKVGRQFHIENANYSMLPGNS